MTSRDASEAQSDLLSKASTPAPGFFAEFVLYLRQSRKWWLVPIVIFLVLASALMFISGSAVAPFIYPLF